MLLALILQQNLRHRKLEIVTFAVFYDNATVPAIQWRASQNSDDTVMSVTVINFL